MTTDTNRGAQRFYEALGYELKQRPVGAVDERRRLYKPSILADMHDELECERVVDPLANEAARPGSR